MPEQPSALDVGFADFVAVLLVETLESIVAAHTSQEERLSALQAAAGLTVEEFAQTGITTELLDATADRLFPDGEGGSTLAVGGPLPDRDALDELGATLEKRDVKDKTLTASGVDRIREALTLYLARRQLEAFREADARGIPRVRVEGGTLRAKLNFTAVDTSPRSPERSVDPEASTTQRAGLAARGGAVTAAANLGLGRLPGTVRNQLIAWDSPLQAGILDSIRRTRLVVSTPVVATGGGEPEPTSRTEVFGEVEIRFRTGD
ncbi:MAG: hypothetical protein ABIZ07_11370 [Dermatophilaceae bacterium]